MSDRRIPGSVAQQKKVNSMNWDQCLSEYAAIDARRSRTSACGGFTIVPGGQTPYQSMLAKRIAFLDHHERVRRIEDSRSFQGDAT